MTDKPKISLSIMPTYHCGKGCEYCYLKQPILGQVHYNPTDALPRKIYKRLKELNEKYKIDTVEVYGGDLNVYNLDYLKRIIESYGVKVIYFSKVTKEGASSLIEVFSNKTTVLMGQSGVGKSSLLNALIPEYNRLIGEYSSALGRGKHQTKEVVLLPFYNGFIADTPGFSSLDIELTPKQIAMSFPVIKDYYGTCFFADCLHISEKGCKVKERIDNGFSSLSYENYLVLIKEAKERKAKY